MILGEWLGMESVERRRSGRLKRRNQRGLVDQRARAVIRIRPASSGDTLRINDAALVVECEVERYHIGARQQRVEIDQRHASRRIAVRFRQSPHADAACNARDLATNAAEPDDAERLAVKLRALARHPQAAAGVTVHAGEFARA